MNQVQEYLLKLGLTSSQARALEVLFNGESLTAKEISSESGVSYTKIYEALSYLESLGVVKFTMDTPKVYHALKPKLVFDTLIAHQKNEIAKLEEVEKQVLEDVEVTWKDVEEHKSEANVWLFKSQSAILEEIIDQFNKAKKTIHGCGVLESSKYVWKYPGLINANYDAVRRGVQDYTIYPKSMVGVKGFLELIGNMSIRDSLKMFKVIQSEKYHLRVLPENEIHQDFLITDKKLAGIGIIGKGVTEWGITFNDPKIAKFMLDYHKLLWEKAEPVENNMLEAIKKKVKGK